MRIEIRNKTINTEKIEKYDKAMKMTKLIFFKINI